MFRIKGLNFDFDNLNDRCGWASHNTNFMCYLCNEISLSKTSKNEQRILNMDSWLSLPQTWFNLLP